MGECGESSRTLDSQLNPFKYTTTVGAAESILAQKRKQTMTPQFTSSVEKRWNTFVKLHRVSLRDS
jgi:hypothetical protein